MEMNRSINDFFFHRLTSENKQHPNKCEKLAMQISDRVLFIQFTISFNFDHINKNFISLIHWNAWWMNFDIYVVVVVGFVIVLFAILLLLFFALSIWFFLHDHSYNVDKTKRKQIHNQNDAVSSVYVIIWWSGIVVQCALDYYQQLC